MKDVASYLLLGFRQAHQLSEAILDLEQRPELRRHPAHSAALADDAVTALAHMAGASADWEANPNSALHAVADARDALARVKRHLSRITTLRFLPEREVAPLVAQADEALAILLAVGALARAELRRAA